MTARPKQTPFFRSTFTLLAFCLSALLTPTVFAAEGEYTVTKLSEPAAGLSEAVTSVLSTEGVRVTGKEGVICDIWFAKEIGLKPGFQPNLRIQYPFLAGQLIGAIRFPDSSKPHDFRGQEFKAGVYTLRYGLQPDDGNHLGTSDIRDFLMACPAEGDKDPKRIEKIKDVFKLSAKAAGTAHPTIFLLLPPAEKAFDAPAVKHDEEKKYVILSINVPTKDKGAEKIIPVNVVTVGQFEG